MPTHLRLCWKNVGRRAGPGRKDAGCVFERYCVFATPLPYDTPRDAIRHVPGRYRKRRRMETGYRSAKPVQARTNSTNPAVRMLLSVL